MLKIERIFKALGILLIYIYTDTKEEYPSYTKNMSLLDLSEEMGLEQFYVFDGHPNKYGHEYIAEK